jgi:peptide deformylase
MTVAAEKLKIVRYPDPILRAKARPLTDITEEIRAVARRMIELMHEAEGVGLAAPQVGLSWRLFVANATGEEGDDRIFVNPTLTAPSEQIDAREEGCLSIPDVRGEIRRPKAITIEALDEFGRPFTLTSDALPARIWQHETDHLDGILIIDRMSTLDKLANRRKLKGLEER